MGNEIIEKARKVFKSVGCSIFVDKNGDTYIEKNQEILHCDEMSDTELEAFAILTADNSDKKNHVKK
jgi:hypothetical protein